VLGRVLLQHFNGQGGEHVIALQTNIGGGKTSSVVGITTSPSTTRQLLIGLLSIVLDTLGRAIA